MSVDSIKFYWAQAWKVSNQGVYLMNEEGGEGSIISNISTIFPLSHEACKY